MFNVAASLIECTNKDQLQCGDNYGLEDSLQRVERFNRRCITVFDAFDDCLSVVVMEQVHKCIRDNRRINIDETTSEISICDGKRSLKDDIKSK